VLYYLLLTKNQDRKIMTIEELKNHVSDSKERLDYLKKYLDIEEKAIEKNNIEKEMLAPDFWNNRERAQEKIAKLSAVKKVIESYETLSKEVEDFCVLAELVIEDGDESNLPELEKNWEKISASLSNLELISFLSGKFDSNNAYFSIHAGAGGTESCDWASILLRMYRRWFEKKGYEVEIIDSQPGEEAGIKGITMLVKGSFAYGYCKAENKKEAAKLVSIGDPIAYRANFARLGKNKIMSKGLDDKIGAFVAVETFRELSESNVKIGVYCVGTVQEELGLRGAHTSAFGIAPQAAFAIDVTFATDTPDMEKKTIGDIKLGKGAVLSRNADTNPVLLRKIKEVAKKKKISFQEEAGFRASGGTDTSVIQLTRSGVATALISIPNRYMHTQVEVCDLRDVESAIKLIKETILSLKESDTFIPC